MDQPQSDWILSWWTPIAAIFGAVFSYIITLVSLRRQFLDHLMSDERTQQALDERLMRMHTDNTDRLDTIQDDIRELRNVILNGHRFAERGH